MAHTEETLKQKLRKELNASHVVVEDISGGCGASFAVVVVSDIFKGKGLLQRQRLVNNCLKEELSNSIHALTQKTYTEQQWQEMRTK